MKYLILIAFFIASSVYAKEDITSSWSSFDTEQVPFVPLYSMSRRGHKGRHQRHHGKGRFHMASRKSELQIRASLKDRYDMKDQDIDIILKARQEILDVMRKYETCSDVQKSKEKK